MMLGLNGGTMKTNAVKKDTNLDRWLNDNIDIENRRIMISEDVEEYCIGDFVKGIMAMLDRNKEKPIDVYVNTYGGSVYDGIALYDFLRSLPVQVRTYAMGKVMSMGIILFLSGDERYSQENSTFMVHEVSGGAIGKSSGLVVEADEARRLNDLLCHIIADRTGKTKKWWHAEMKFTDKYYDKRTAAKLGIVKEK